MPGRDTRTRYQGVYARHQERCPVTDDPSAACHCSPSYWGKVWDRSAGKPRKTKRFTLIREAKNACEDLERQVREGKLPAPTGPRLGDAIERFVAAARDGVALNKWGRRYRPRAWRDLESALRQVPGGLRRKRLDEVRRGDIQRLVDELAERGLSGSRIRSVVHAIHSLYRWAQDRELASGDPAALVRLPVMAAVARDRVASPDEFARLLSALELKDALPFALAGYATARHQEIRTLDWAHVHLELGAIELAGDEEGRKPGGSWRIVPLVAPLRSLLRRAWLEQGRPRAGKVCPSRKESTSGLLALGHLQERVHERWRRLGLKPIGLHEARHTASTWLDHAGVSPKVASQLMGHKTPEYQPGAAPITLRRYTHVLPGELERAREQLDRFLAERTRDKSQRSFGPPDGPPRN